MPTDLPPGTLPPRSPLWGQLPPAQAPTEAQLLDVRERLLARAARARVLRRRALVLTSIATLALWMWLYDRATPPPIPSQHPAASVNATLSRSAAPVAPPAPILAPPASPAAPAAALPAAASRPLAAAPRSHPRSPAAAPAPLASAPAPDTAADDESTLLGQALFRLNRQADPEGALKLIDTYRQRFPNGELAGEAQLVRTRALLQLGRREELVAELQPERIGNLPRAQDLLVLRAETLAQLGRCPQSTAELTALLERADLAPALRERALADRTRCRAPSAQPAEAPEGD